MKESIDSTKIQRQRRSKIHSVEQGRWAAYATAALASSFTFSLPDSTEAKIHYSGPVNRELSGSSSVTLPLGNDGVIKLEHFKHYFGTIICTTSTHSCGPCDFSCSLVRQQNHNAPQTITWYYDAGSAFFKIYAPSGAVRGVEAGCATWPHSSNCVSASRLTPHDVISAGPFAPAGGILAAQQCYALASAQQPRYPCYWLGRFGPAGLGAVGFKFNTGAGDQYGWARVRMEGFPFQHFRIVDYAYGDPGDVVQVGRQRSNESAPTIESLGGLALGAAGILAWRRRRANKRAAA
jgi:MYXO-CTERM domain-containing protein